MGMASSVCLLWVYTQGCLLTLIIKQVHANVLVHSVHGRGSRDLHTAPLPPAYTVGHCKGMQFSLSALFVMLPPHV